MSEFWKDFFFFLVGGDGEGKRIEKEDWRFKSLQKLLTEQRAVLKLNSFARYRWASVHYWNKVNTY